MKKNQNIIIAGFGGQGVLFAGRVMTLAGMLEGKEVSWFPSYGPEMRGGTANCSVCISDRPIGSPLVINPNILIALSQPSFDKFIDMVKPGGIALVDSGFIPEHSQKRADITTHFIPATRISIDEGLAGLATLIMLGKILSETLFPSIEMISQAVGELVPPRNRHLIEPNIRALKLGMSL